MTPILDRSVDAMPPADLEAERLLLGALLIADQYPRNQATLLVNADAFHDPFHKWLFVAIRAARTSSTVAELLLSIYQHDRPSWIGRNLGAWLIDLIVRRDGSSCCGSFRLRRVYAERLNRIQRRREQITKLEVELSRLITTELDQ